MRARRALALVAFVALIASVCVIAGRAETRGSGVNDHPSFAALVGREVAAPVLLSAPVRLPAARSIDGITAVTLAAAAVALIAARAKRIIPVAPQPARRSLCRPRRGPPPLRFVFA